LHTPLPPTLVFWRGVARRYFTALCHHPDRGDANTPPLERRPGGRSHRPTPSSNG
jgi:hypothetical protein